MKQFLCAIVLTILSAAGFRAYGQPGILDPADPDVIFTSTNQPAAPAYGRMHKWGHTNRLGWNPYNNGYRSYYFNGMAFRLKFPKSYVHNANDGKKYPLLVFCHGLGERGNIWDNEYQLLHGGQLHAQRVDNGTFDGFLLYHQSQNGFHNAYFSKIAPLIDSLVKYTKVDIDRVILSGLSSGGQGVWDFIGEYPRSFAAAIPISAAQLEDMAFFNNYLAMPIWTSNGGLDRNPAPATAKIVVDSFRALGGNIRQTYYPSGGHGIWTNHWNEPDYFPYLSTPHKANPLVYFGRREFCADDTVFVKLGLQSGFFAYEWRKDGVTIPGATQKDLVVSTYGSYQGRFKRTATSDWSAWSPTPVNVGLKPPTITPPIQINGLKSNVLPAPDGSTTVPLMVPNTYVNYEWRRVSDNALVGSSNIFNALPGQYRVKVTELYGCSSSFSAIFTVTDATGTPAPDKASNLVAISQSNTTIQLDWSDNPTPVNNETGFEIYRATSAGGPYQLIQINPADNLSFLDQGLAPNTRYYYIVRAVNNNGAAGNSSEASAVTQSDSQAPTSPYNLRLTATTRTSITLGWDASTDDVGVVKYDIYVNGQKSYSTSDLNFVVNNLTSFQTYNFFVKARDNAGNVSPASNQVTGVPMLSGLNYKYYHGSWSVLPDFNTLSPVSTGNSANVDISVRTQNDNIGFLWEGFINIPVTGSYTFETRSDDGSKLYLGPYSHTAAALVNNDGLHGMQYAAGTVTLTAGTYPIAITFFERTGGEGMEVYWTSAAAGIPTRQLIPSSAFRDNPGSAGAPPALPHSLTAVQAGYNKINLAWVDNSSNETGFEIIRSNSRFGIYTTIATVGQNVTTYTDSALAANTAYWYKIRAIGAFGESAYTGGFRAAWSLDNTYNDESGNARNMTGVNGPVFESVDKVQGTHSIRLDGSNDFLNMGFSGTNQFPGDNYNARTISMWLKPLNTTVNGTRRTVFDFGGNDNGIAMQFNANQLQVGVASANTRVSITTTTTLPTDPVWVNGGWNHVAVVYNQNTIRLYINGVLKASNTVLPFSSISQTTNVSRIGATTGSNAFNTGSSTYGGLMDDIVILNEAATATDVQSLMQQRYVSAVTAVLPAAPAAPTNLVATAQSTSVVNLTWDDNATTETGYEIWRSVNGNTNFRLLATIGANATAQGNFADSGLYANVTYYYEVRAKGVGGLSAYSNEDSAKTNNNLPVLDNINSFTMRFDSQRILNLEATDQDGELLTLTVQGLPAFGVFNNTGNGTGTITLNPLVTDQGVYPIRVIAADGNNGADTLDFNLTVNSNYVPVFTTLADATMLEGDDLTIPVVATDQDGNTTIVLSASGLPSFVTFNPGANGTGSLLADPNFAQSGVYTISVTADDGSGGITTEELILTVNEKEPGNNKYFVNILQTGLPAAPAPWNNVTGLTASNLVDQNNAASPLGLQFLTTSWKVFNQGAVTGNNSGVFPDNAIRDYYYFGIFGAPNTVDVRITGLDTAYRYNLAFLASSKWTGVADNGSTVYTINSVSRTLYAQNNSQNTAVFNVIKPDASGNITITMSKAPGTPVGYLNAFTIEKIFDDGTAPVLPGNVTAENLTNGSVKIKWKDIAYNELSYEVYRSTSENGTYTLLNAGANNANATEFIDNTVQGLTTYYYKVAAVNSYGSSGLTDAVSITTLNKAPVINAISTVYVKSGNSSTINVNATDDAGETLTVELLNKPGFVTFTPGANGAGTIQINPGIDDIGIYKDVTVKVTDNFGASSTRLFDINVNDNGTRSVYVNLAGPSGSPEGKPWNNLVSYPFSNLTLANLKDEEDVTTPYSFRLVDQWTQGFLGGMITGNNSGVFPDNVILSSIYETTTNAKRIQFTGLNPAKIYNVALFCSNNAGFDATATFTSGTQSVTINAMYNSNKMGQLNGLVPNGSGVIEITMTKASAATYAFLNAVVLQEYDNTLPIVRPIQLFAEPQSPDKIKLDWSDRSANETGFEIWRAQGGGSYSLLTTVPANTNTYTDNGLAGNTRYFYKVRALNGGVQSDYSNTAQTILASYMVRINLNLVLPQAAPWNNTNSAPVEGAGIDAMLNTSGNNTGFSMTVTQPFGGHFDLGMTNGVYPDNVMLTSWWVEGGGQTGTIRFYNLDQSKRYRVGFFGSSSWTGDFTGTYTINGRTTYLNAHKNTTKTVYLENVMTNADGEINIDFSSLSTTRWAFTSAIILEVYADDGSTEPVIISNRNFSPVLVKEEVPESRQIPVVAEEKAVIREVKVFPNPFNESLTVMIATEKQSNLSVLMFDATGKIISKQQLGRTDAGTRTIRLESSAITQAVPGIYILQVLVDGKPEKTVRLVKTK